MVGDLILLSVPLNADPIGVRAVETITASFMVYSSSWLKWPDYTSVTCNENSTIFKLPADNSGLDPEPVRPQLSEIRSMGHGKVLLPDTRDLRILRVYLMHMAHKLGERLRINRLVADRYLYGLRLHQGWLKATRRFVLPNDDEQVIYRLGETWLRHCWQGQGIWQIRIVALNPGLACQADLFQRKRPGRQRNHQAMDSINTRYGPMTLTSARLLDRSSMPDVISPAWKPEGHRKSL